MAKFTQDSENPIEIISDQVILNGILQLPQDPRGIILFAHGSGSSRFSPRNQYIARELQNAHFATLLFDLLTNEEDEIDTVTAQYRFDIKFLANRLRSATKFIMQTQELNHLPIGYFGASTGGGAALVAASRMVKEIKAVVSRGGRPDLAGESLQYVAAPTLLIVGGDDGVVINLNQEAMVKMHCAKKLEIIPGASHLFEEPGALEAVAKLAVKWFEKYLK